ncbi:MAG: winged helix-turn-helix transcriptional regulator [Austwickia sp.]|nr:winged helix-turn-helix transcriptional regulator [Austwickia sp.]
MTVRGVPVYEAKAELFKSLGHPVRIRVLELLVEREHAVRELLDLIEVEQAGLSQHLAVLRRTGLVRHHRSGGHVIYSLVGDEAAQLLQSARRLLLELLDSSRELGESLTADEPAEDLNAPEPTPEPAPEPADEHRP